MGLFRKNVSPTAGANCQPGDARGVRRLRSRNEWEALLDASRGQPVLVFKHSTICGISSEVLAEFLEFLRHRPPIPVGLVHVVEDRPMSDTIAGQMGVRHESPQLIAIRDQRPVWHASHWSIDFDELTLHLAGGRGPMGDR